MTSPDLPSGFGVRNVYFSYGMRTILRDVTFSVMPGEIHALVGGHNEGKSTLCGIMNGRLAPESGLVTAPGQAFPFVNPRIAKKYGFAGLSNNTKVYPRMTVLWNLVVGDSARWLGLFPERRYRVVVSRWLADNNIELPLSAPMHELPRNLWVVVEALCKLYQNPRLLVMDDALEEVPQPWLGKLLAIIGRHVAGGMGMLMVTHKIEDALNIADRVTVMRQGSIILSNASANMERLNLIRMCYSQLDADDDTFVSQERFQELMRYTEAMLRDLPSAVVILDPLLNVRFVNRAGREILDAALRGGGGELFGPDNPRLREAVLAAAAAGGEAEHHGLPVVSGDRKLIADVMVRPIREKNVVVGTLVTINDISIREELRRRLVLSEQQASIGLLAAGVAHEVNNPLEILGNYLTYLRDDVGAPDAPEVISRMEEEIARIHEIVDSLVMKSGKSRGDETVDVMALAAEICGLLRFHGGFRNVQFSLADSDGRALVAASSSELRQVFINLIRNSFDAMTGGGRIAIDCAVDEAAGRVGIRFSDNGPGINLDNPNDVFLPFTTTKKGEGVHQGLGLYIVYGIIEKSGGSIRVENAPGGGCVFVLDFPLARMETSAPSI